MANLKEIRNRITSVSSTMQITSAMKMVSAAKLKKAQNNDSQRANSHELKWVCLEELEGLELVDKTHREVRITYSKITAHKNIWNYIS